MDVNGTVALIAVASPILMVIANAAMRRWEKKQDYDRQDEVARQAKKVSDDLIAGQVAAAEALKNNQAQVAAVAETTNKNIGRIKKLINSDTTERKRELVDAYLAQIAYMQELIDVKKSAGQEPSPDAVSAVAALRTRIEGLQAAIAAREELHQREIEAEASEALAKKSRVDVFNGTLDVVEGKS